MLKVKIEWTWIALELFTGQGSATLPEVPHTLDRLRIQQHQPAKSVTCAMRNPQIRDASGAQLGVPKRNPVPRRYAGVLDFNRADIGTRTSVQRVERCKWKQDQVQTGTRARKT